MKTSDMNRKRLSRVAGLMILAAALVLTVFLGGCSTKPKKPPVASGEKGRARGFLSQGNKQFDAGLNEAAAGSYKKALSLYGGLNDDGGIIHTLLAMARNYMIVGQNREALEILGYAETYAAMTRDPLLLRSVYNARAEYLVRQGDAEGALALCDEKLVPDVPPQSEEAAGLYRVRGKVLKRLERYPEAEESLKKALDADTTLMHQGDMAADCYLLASVYSLTADYPRAVALAEKALALDRTVESMTGIAADLTALATIHEKAGDGEKALAYWHQAYMAWRGLGREAERKEASDAIRRLSGKKDIFLP